MNNIESSTGEIVMYQPDETIRLEVRMGEETVWLTQQQMAELFDKDRTVIGRHIRNMFIRLILLSFCQTFNELVEIR